MMQQIYPKMSIAIQQYQVILLFRLLPKTNLCAELQAL